jgi:predicted nuclease with TOPRIM domain
MTMEDFLKRMHEELGQLKERKDKLNDFIENNPKFDELSNIQRILLINQFNAMDLYYYALESRIEFIND